MEYYPKYSIGYCHTCKADVNTVLKWGQFTDGVHKYYGLHRVCSNCGTLTEVELGFTADMDYDETKYITPDNLTDNPIVNANKDYAKSSLGNYFMD